jgi:hypothetical protein
MAAMGRKIARLKIDWIYFLLMFPLFFYELSPA